MAKRSSTAMATTCCSNVMAADYTYFEGLTFRNTNIAIEAGQKKIAGAIGLNGQALEVRERRRSAAQRLVGLAQLLHRRQRDDRPRRSGLSLRLAAHLAVGRRPGVRAEAPHEVVLRGIDLRRRPRDGIQPRAQLPRRPRSRERTACPDDYPNTPRDRMPVSIDIYGNDVSNVHDNCFETDGGMHNVRLFRNLCFNVATGGMSPQPICRRPPYMSSATGSTTACTGR